MPFDISQGDVGSIRVVNLRGTIVAGIDRGMLHDKMQKYIGAGGRISSWNSHRSPTPIARALER